MWECLSTDDGTLYHNDAYTGAPAAMIEQTPRTTRLLRPSFDLRMLAVWHDLFQADREALVSFAMGSKIFDEADGSSVTKMSVWEEEPQSLEPDIPTSAEKIDGGCEKMAAGGRVQKTVKTSKPDSVLWWRFQVNGGKCHFQLLEVSASKRAPSAKSSELTEIIEKRKYDGGQDCLGSVQVGPGEFHFIWENSSSYMKSKKLDFSIFLQDLPAEGRRHSVMQKVRLSQEAGTDTSPMLRVDSVNVSSEMIDS